MLSYLKQLDIAFPVLHGLYGEDGTIQGLLELLKIPYVGCHVLASSIGMDKVYTKIVFEKAGLKQAKYEYIRKYKDKYIYIDEQGYLLEKSNEKIDVPTITGMEVTENDVEKQKRLDENDLDKMENVLQIKEQCKRIGIADKITEIQVKNEYILTLGNEQITINLGDATNLKSRIDYVAALLKQEAGNAGTIYVNGNLNGGFLPYFSAN